MPCYTLQLSLIAQLPLAQAGQLLLVTAISFAIIVLISSAYRFHQMIQLSEESLVTQEDCDNFFSIQITRYLSKINRTSTGFGVFIVQFRTEEKDKRPLQDTLLKTLRRIIREATDKPCLFRNDCVAVIIDTEEKNVPAMTRRMMDELQVDALTIPGIQGFRAGAASFPMHGLNTQTLVDTAIATLERVDFDSPLPFCMAPAPVTKDADQVESEPIGELSKEDKNAALDPLTGVLKATVIGSYIRKYLAEIRHKKQPATLLCVGINRIDQIIKLHGELAADDVIAGVAKILKNRTRDCDIIGRYHRDDFLILAPCSLQQGEQIAIRLREAVQKEIFISRNKQIKASVSIGIAAHPEHGRNVRDLFGGAYRALETVRGWNTTACLVYDPKQHGKKKSENETRR